jgi:hypothetical protein
MIEPTKKTTVDARGTAGSNAAGVVTRSIRTAG